MSSFFLALEGSSHAREVPLSEGTFVVGREKADILLQEPGVSRAHLRIQVEGGVVFVEDLASRNGTTIAGKRIEGRIPWAPGERLRIGAAILELRGGAEGIEPKAAFAGWRWKAAGPIAGVAIGVASLVALCVAWGGGAEAATQERRLPIESGGGHGTTEDEREASADPSLVYSWRPRHASEGSAASLQFELVPGEGAESVEPFLNGISLEVFRPDSMGFRSILLPAKLIQEGENEIRFRGLPQGGWTIRGVGIVEEPVPACERSACLREAAELVHRGKGARDADAIAPGKLFEAWDLFRRARLQLQDLHPRPDLHATAIGLWEETGELLEARCRRLRFQVIQRVALGEEEKAEEAAREFLRHFPLPDHPCHRRAKDLLARLAPE